MSFQALDSPIPQQISKSMVLRVGIYDGISSGNSLATGVDGSVALDAGFGAQGAAGSRKIITGFKGGVSITKFTGDDANLEGELEAEPGNLSSYTMGGFLRVRISEKFSLQPELLYTVKGNIYHVAEEVSEPAFTQRIEMTTKVEINWVELPLLGVYQIQPGLKVFTGPYLEAFSSGRSSVNYSISMSYGDASMSDSDSDSQQIERDDINDLGYGIIVGIGYDINPKLSLEARYTKGHSTLDKKPKDWPPDGGVYEVSDVRNSGILIFLSYSLQ